MQAKLIDGKARAEVARGGARMMAAQKVTPGLAVVLVDDDPASEVHVRNTE